MFFAFPTFLYLRLRQNVFPGRFNPPLTTSGNFAFYFRSKWRPCWKHPYNIFTVAPYHMLMSIKNPTRAPNFMVLAESAQFM